MLGSVLQRTGTAVWESNSTGASFYLFTDGTVFHTPDWRMTTRAVDYQGDSVILDPSKLLVGVPQHFVLDGQRLTVIKNLDDSIDFYQSPDEG